MVFIISEIGVNWDGNFDLAQEMIERSKKAGCDAVKFQSFEENLVKNHPEKTRLMKCTINKSNIEQIHEIAKKSNIEWFCTPMYPDAVNLLEPYVQRYKMRELDGRVVINNQHSEILSRILKGNKEVMISSNTSPRNCKFYDNKKIKWLYCVPKYPCDIKDVDFTNLKEFDGYSNHSTELMVPLTAVILGAKVIEVHITSNKLKEFVDNNVSFDYDELQKLVNEIRIVEQIKKSST